MTTTHKLLIIDGFNLAYRAQYKFNLTNREGKPSSVVYGFPYILRSLLAKIPSYKVYAVFDGGRAKERTKILPGYKVRDNKLGDDRASFEEQIGDVKDLLLALNCEVVWERGVEADDLIYELCRAFPTVNKTIVSSDKDFVQLVGPKTKLYNPFKDAFVTHLNAKELYGFSAIECVDYLCLDGDKSDKIPGVKGFGPKTIRNFLDEFGSIDDFLEEDNPGKWPRDLIKETYSINKRLISLRSFHLKYRRGFPIPTWEGCINLPKVKELTRKYDITHFNKPEFLNAFQRLKNETDIL